MSLIYMTTDTVVVFINHFSLIKVIEFFGPVGSGIIDCLLVVIAIIYSELFVTTMAFNPYRWLGIVITICVFGYDSLMGGDECPSEAVVTNDNLRVPSLHILEMKSHSKKG